MTKFHSDIRSVLTEVNSFLNETLRQEKLSQKSVQHKEKIQQLVYELRQSYPQLLPDGDKSVFTQRVRIADIAAKDLCNVAKAGFLDKRRKKEVRLRGVYQRRYCVIEYGVFYYYIHPTDKKQAGAFSLSGYKFETAPYLPSDQAKADLSFELTGSNLRTFQFLAESKQDLEEWRKAVEKFNGLTDKPNTSEGQAAAWLNQSITTSQGEETYELVNDQPFYEIAESVKDNSDSDDMENYIEPLQQPECKQEGYGGVDVSPLECSYTDAENSRQTAPVHAENEHSNHDNNYPPDLHTSPPPSAKKALLPPTKNIQKTKASVEKTSQQPEKPAPALKPRTQFLTKPKTPPPVAPKYGRKPPNMNEVNRNNSENVHAKANNNFQIDSSSSQIYDDAATNWPDDESRFQSGSRGASRDEVQSSLYTDAQSFERGKYVKNGK